MTNQVPLAKEVSVIRLPVQLSDAVELAVANFVKKHKDNSIKAYQRWHGADLWMIFVESRDDESDCTLARRVTIGTYSDDPQKLAFIPDIVVTKPEGRYILPPQLREKRIQKTVFTLRKADEALIHDKTNEDIKNNLDEAWKIAKTFSPEEATLLL